MNRQIRIQPKQIGHVPGLRKEDLLRSLANVLLAASQNEIGTVIFRANDDLPFSFVHQSGETTTDCPDFVQPPNHLRSEIQQSLLHAISANDIIFCMANKLLTRFFGVILRATIVVTTDDESLWNVRYSKEQIEFEAEKQKE